MLITASSPTLILSTAIFIFVGTLDTIKEALFSLAAYLILPAKLAVTL